MRPASRMRTRTSRLVAAVASAFLVLGGSATLAAQASASTYMQSSYSSLRVKPSTVTFGAAGRLSHIHWRGWGGRTATARRVRYENNGYSGRNTIRVSRRITCKGHRVYSRLRILGRGSPGAITLTCKQIGGGGLRFRKRR